jgi:hypothetical protein
VFSCAISTRKWAAARFDALLRAAAGRKQVSRLRKIVRERTIFFARDDRLGKARGSG